MSFRLVQAACIVCMFLLLGVRQAHGQYAPLPLNPTNVGNTPFEHNNKVFATSKQAEDALESSNPLMRRSGVEWLGLWTNLYLTQRNTVNAKNCAELQGQKWLVPSLTRAVREMPADDRRQAARLLTLIGPAARSAIPTVCIACVTPSYGESEQPPSGYTGGWPDVLDSLTHLCGGPHQLAPTLTALMQDREPNIRWAATTAAQSFYNLSFNNYLSPGDSYWMTAPEQRQWEADFRRQMMPVLTGRINDTVIRVRLAALTSLNSMTYGSADAPWQKALPSISHALNFAEADQRLVAAQILAYAPVDVSPVAASLRTALHRNDDTVQPYIITALSHAAWSNPSATLDAFLPELSNSSVDQRRSAAGDIQRAIGGLWSGDGQAGYKQIPDSTGNVNNFYDTRMMTWSLDVDRHVPSSQSVILRTQRLKTGNTAKNRLLGALVQATADPDHAVRMDAELALEQIGQWDDGGLSSGYFPNPAVEYQPLIVKSLTQAVEALKTTEPNLAKRLLNLQRRIQTPHDTA